VSAVAVISVPAGNYDVYASLGDESKQEQSQIFIQGSNDTGAENPCTQIGNALINGKGYTKLAKTDINGATSIYLSTPTTGSATTASGPRVVLVSSENKQCDFASGCSVNFQGESFSVSPRKISSNSHSLRVGLLLEVTNDTVERVTYTINQNPVYTSKKIQKFDERYVPGGEHLIGRTILLDSGQTLSDSNTINRGKYLQPNLLLQSAIFRQISLVIIVLLIIGVLLIWVLFLTIARAVHRRRKWERTHIASKSLGANNSKLTGPQSEITKESIFATILRYRKIWLSIIGVALVLVLITTYVISPFNVDGVSMEPTLKDAQRLPVIKAQRTLARINRSEYVPKRGTILVINKSENVYFDKTQALSTIYVVKRVIGLPGERVVVKNGVVTIFELGSKSGFEPDKKYNWISDLRGSEEFNIDITLKASEIFVLGDNRRDSIDSRSYGPLDISEILGTVHP
jgi:signal peptidase I